MSKPEAIFATSSRLVSILGLTALGMVPSSVFAHEAQMQGLVLGTMPATSQVVVRHDALLGKPASISTFRVIPASALHAVHVGSTIEATADGDASPPTLSDVRITGTQRITGEVAVEPLGKVLRNVHHVVVGEYAPNTTAFVDQNGKPFNIRDLRGQAVVMAFVYTRCRDARECPLITARFGALQERFVDQPVHLVEVTLDPSYDTASVLARYARTFGARPGRWTFLTGKPDAVLDFAAQFDVTAFPDERVGIIHPERLVVLDKYGAIRELIDEGAWSPGEVVSTVRSDERLSSNPFERLDLWLSSAAVSVCGNSVASFSGFTDLLAIVGIAGATIYGLYRLGRGIAGGTT